MLINTLASINLILIKLIQSKKKLRVFYIKKRLNISNIERNIWSNEITNRCLKLPIWNQNFFHIFLPIKEKNEVDTYPLLNRIKEKNKKIIIPKINGFNLNHYLFDNNISIKKNHFGIPEPLNGIKAKINLIEVVFVPLIIADKFGNRVGYGKGYYDRFLKKCDKEIIKVGLCFFDVIERIVDITVNDIKLNYCVTPNKIIKF
jgi:5-formyltetrahydrofolate cyclo-ligase